MNWTAGIEHRWLLQDLPFRALRENSSHALPKNSTPLVFPGDTGWVYREYSAPFAELAQESHHLRHSVHQGSSVVSQRELSCWENYQHVFQKGIFLKKYYKRSRVPSCLHLVTKIVTSCMAWVQDGFCIFLLSRLPTFKVFNTCANLSFIWVVCIPMRFYPMPRFM